MAKGIINTTTDNWDKDVLKADKLVFVEFCRKLCPPCWAIASTIEKIAEVYTGRLKVVKLNTAKNPEIAIRYNIMSVPSFMFFKDGKEIDRIVGLVQKPELKKKIDDLLG